MADELKTIRTTELQELDDTSQVKEILVNSSNDACRIDFEKFLTLMKSNSNWDSIKGKPFAGINRNYFTLDNMYDLTLQENIITTLQNANDIHTAQTVISDKLTKLDEKSHIHENKNIIDLFSISEDTNKLMWNGAEVGYKLTPATSDTLGGVKVDGETITIDENGTLHGANTYELPVATAGSLGGVKVDGDSIGINENGTIFAVPKGGTGTIEINADCVVLYATFSADGWSSEAPYTQTVIVEGITENHVPIVDISYSEDTSLWQNEENAFALLSKVETGNGNIIGTCLSNKPEINFTIKLKIAGDITYDTVVSKEEFNNTIGNINTVLASVTGGIS